ncbi:TPA: tail fiber assembly protein [Raoultella planticola]
MIILNNFTSTIKRLGDFNAVFFTDESGHDWYDIQKTLSPETLKIMFDSSGRIVAASFDASMLSPDGMSVAEITPENIPETFFTRGTQWQFDGKGIVPYQLSADELREEAEEQKRALMARAATAIAPLEDAELLGEATAEEKSRLTAWRRYRVLLNRLEVSSEPDIEWPAMPDDQQN